MTHQLSSIGYAVHKALLMDLEPLTEYKRIWSFEEKKQILDKENPVFVRPYESDIHVYSFPQSFSDTTLGFGGVGGQAFTTAQVTVVVCGLNACVYVNGRICHKIKKVNQKFWEDLGNQNMRSKMLGKEEYEQGDE